MPKLKPNQFYLPSGQLITELPILMQTNMVKATLDDRKTQTRRTRGLESINVDPGFWNRKGDPRKNTVRLWDSAKECNPNPLAISFGFRDPIDVPTYIKSIYGKPGDLLWVKETYTTWMEMIQYKADTPKGDEIGHWKPSIHLPKSAARIWLMIEDIRVERVQDILEADAISEGIEKHYSDLFKEWRYRDYHDGKRRAKAFAKYPEMAKQTGFGSMPWPDWRDPISSFNTLWLSINGEASWNANPWVWVIKFRVLSKVGRPSQEVIERNYLEVTGKEVAHV